MILVIKIILLLILGKIITKNSQPGSPSSKPQVLSRFFLLKLVIYNFKAALINVRKVLFPAKD